MPTRLRANRQAVSGSAASPRGSSAIADSLLNPLVRPSRELRVLLESERCQRVADVALDGADGKLD
jgi:hypothetical protein